MILGRVFFCVSIVAAELLNVLKVIGGATPLLLLGLIPALLAVAVIIVVSAVSGRKTVPATEQREIRASSCEAPVSGNTAPNGAAQIPLCTAPPDHCADRADVFDEAAGREEPASGSAEAYDADGTSAPR